MMFLWWEMNLSASALSLVAIAVNLGLSLWGAVGAAFISGSIIAAAIVFQGMPGVKYGVPFAVYARLSFGWNGAYWVAVTRGVVALFWATFNMYISAGLLDAGIAQVSPGWREMPPLSDDLSTGL